MFHVQKLFWLTFLAIPPEMAMVSSPTIEQARCLKLEMFEKEGKFVQVLVVMFSMSTEMDISSSGSPPIR